MDENISKKDKEDLLKLARQVIETLALNSRLIDPDDSIKNLSMKRGVFVTLNKGKQLRGCIGNILPEKKLYEAVIENSKSSAFKDPRFSPVSPGELSEIEIEISILSVPVTVEYNSPEDLRERITPFEDGVILSFGMRRSTFLPQVWDDLPDFDSFMSHLSLKAGMEPDAWKRMKPVVEIYKADHFSESDLL